MEQAVKTPQEAFREYEVSKTEWTQVPRPEKIFGEFYRRIKHLHRQYEEARIKYDRYMASLIYEVSLHQEQIRSKKLLPKYAERRKKIRIDPIFNVLPSVKEALPNHIAKDFREHAA